MDATALSAFATLAALMALGSGCVAGTDALHGEAAASRGDAWDSASGNPTHATHSYLTDFAIDGLSADYPEVATYREQLVDGANTELHDLVLDDPTLEQLRHDFGGTNAACQHPDVVWSYANAWYAQGRKDYAYWYLGILLHYVEDMGVPAHALGVYHQGDWAHHDDFELMAVQSWDPLFDVDRADPRFEAPSDYMFWNGTWTASDFHDTFPGVTYTTRFFAASWLTASDTQATFVREREGRTALAAMWTLETAAWLWRD